MKKLTITALTLTLLATTTALAQTNRTRAQSAQASMVTLDRNNAGSQAYAFAPGSTMGSQPGLYSSGRYLGWDPDPNIRTQLLREFPEAE